VDCVHHWQCHCLAWMETVGQWWVPLASALAASTASARLPPLAFGNHHLILGGLPREEDSQEEHSSRWTPRRNLRQLLMAPLLEGERRPAPPQVVLAWLVTVVRLRWPLVAAVVVVAAMVAVQRHGFAHSLKLRGPSG